MKKKILTACFAVLFFCGCNGVPKIQPPMLSDVKLDSQKKMYVRNLLKVVDALYQVDSFETTQDAIRYLKIILNLNPQESKAYWRLSRAYQWLYENESNTAKQDVYAQKGLDAAGKGTLCDSKSAGCHYYYAISLGLYIKIHTTSAIKGLPKIIEHGKLAVLYDASFDFAGPHQLLGRIYLEAPSHLGGDLDLALDHLEKAKNLAPDFAENLLALGKARMEEEEIREAKQLFLEIYNRDKFQDFPRGLRQVKREALEKLIDLDRGYGEYLLALAKICFQDGDLEKGRDLLEEVLIRQDFQDSPKSLYKIRLEASNLQKKWEGKKKSKKRPAGGYGG